MGLDRSPTFKIGPISVYGDLILAPMDGYSSLPFRSVCRELGSAMSYTEFIGAIEILNGHPLVREKLIFLPEERPIAFQIFDNHPDRLVKAALILQEKGADIIDVNLGCSAKRVSGRGAGAGLLRAPETIALIFQQLTRALRVPVTAKIRLGWDEATRNHCLIARIIAENGGALIAVHGRTRAQGYQGQADWDAIAEVRQAVSIPVIANGDVNTVADIERIKQHTGCLAVMIGRAALHNPWLFSRMDRNQVPWQQVRQGMLRHLECSLAFYGEERGLIIFRKFAVRYLSPYSIPPQIRRELLTCDLADDFRKRLYQLPIADS